MAMYTSIGRKEDEKTVAKRKRMLSFFLDRLLSDAELRGDKVVGLFLNESADVKWSEAAVRTSLSPLHDQVPINPSSTCEQLMRKVEGLAPIIQLAEVERTLQSLETALEAIEEAERRRLRKLTGYLYFSSLQGMQEALSDLGCSLNAFSLEYDDPGRIASTLAKSGERIDADASALSLLVEQAEAVCDAVHEQRLVCQEARRILAVAAHHAVFAEQTHTIHQAKSVQLTALESSGGDEYSINTAKEQLVILERDRQEQAKWSGDVHRRACEAANRSRQSIMRALINANSDTAKAHIDYHSAATLSYT